MKFDSNFRLLIAGMIKVREREILQLRLIQQDDSDIPSDDKQEELTPG